MIWAHYILQVNIYLALFYCFYRILLSKETYFNYNRVYLLGAAFLSLIIPFLRVEWFTKQEAAQQIYYGVDQLNSFVAVATSAPAADEGTNWGRLVVLLYLCGIIFFGLRFIANLISLKKLFVKKERNYAFSFFKKKLVDPALPFNEVIHQHEDEHIRGLHSVDILFFEFLAVIFWFNPIIKYYKSSIKSIHEFLADEKAANFQGDKSQYALILLSNALQIDPHVLSNNFASRSLIKKRIFMLHKQRSRKTAILKYGLVVPLFGLALVFSSATIRNNEQMIKVAETLPLSEIILTPAFSAQQVEEVAIVDKKRAPADDWQGFYRFLANRIKYPSEAIRNTVQGNSLITFTLENGQVKETAVPVSLGSGCDAESMRNILAYDTFDKSLNGKFAIQIAFRISGTDAPLLNEHIKPIAGIKFLKPIFVTGIETGTLATAERKLNSIIIRGVPTKIYGENGKISDNTVVVVNGEITSSASLNQIDPEKIKSVNILKGADAEILYGSAASKGAIIVTTSEDSSVKSREAGQDSKVYSYEKLDKIPQYPGGINEFRNFLAKEIRYPASALKRKTQGVVFVNFIVEKDGKLSNIRVDRKVGGGLDEEAIRVVQSSKDWTPGSLNGEPVRSKFVTPIKFTFNSKKKG